MSENYIRLICGDLDQEDGVRKCEIKSILLHLSSVLRGISKELNSLKEAEDSKVLILAPFLARSWLEVALTAVIGRLDPFRIITVKRMQLSTGYDRSMPWKSAIRWQGDVLSSTGRVKDMWSSSAESKDLSRALYGDYYDELYWKPALQSISDFVSIGNESRWLSELLAIPVDSLSARKRESISALYSELSKSVHFESVTASAMISDRISIVDLVQKCFRETAEIALLAHMVSHSFSRISMAKAIKEFTLLEDIEVLE